jgi:WD40 repeat protein
VASRGESNEPISDNGRVPASEGNDGAVRLWDPPTGRRIGAVMTGHRLVPGSDGRLLTAAFTQDAVTLR